MLFLSGGLIVLAILLSGCTQQSSQAYVEKCNDLPEIESKMQCKYELFSKQELSFCDSLSAENDKYYCYSSIAMAKKDKELCNLLDNENWVNTYQNSCIAGVAEATKDSQLCIEITDEIPRDMCYLAVATAKKDAKICDLIVKSDIKGKCVENTA